MNSVALEMLTARGVDLDDLARLVLELQLPYNPALTLEDAKESVRQVLAKREVQYAVITGVTLDMMAEEGTLKEPLGQIIRENHRLFAVDEVLAFSILNIYGSISLSNFGYLDQERPEVLASLDRSHRVNTFLDDLVAAIVAAACARIAHNSQQ